MHEYTKVGLDQSPDCEAKIGCGADIGYIVNQHRCLATFRGEREYGHGATWYRYHFQDNPEDPDPLRLHPDYSLVICPACHLCNAEYLIEEIPV